MFILNKLCYNIISNFACFIGGLKKMLGFVIAMEIEAQPLLNLLNTNKQFSLAGKKCFKGELFNNDVTVIISEIGKVNAGSATQALITRFPEIDRIINIGVAGAVNPELKICDICIVEKTLQYDFDVTAIDSVPLGYIQNIKQQYIYSDKKLYGNLFPLFNRSVTVATADRFSNQKSEADLIKTLGGDIRDMELGAIAQVCLLNQIPFASIKSISDTAEGDASADFKENLLKSSACIEKHLEKIFEVIHG